MADDLRTVALNALPDALQALARTDPKAALSWIDAHLTPPAAPHVGVYGGVSTIGAPDGIPLMGEQADALSPTSVPVSAPVRIAPAPEGGNQ